jgi:hypothetical protein
MVVYRWDRSAGKYGQRGTNRNARGQQQYTANKVGRQKNCSIDGQKLGASARG